MTQREKGRKLCVAAIRGARVAVTGGGPVKRIALNEDLYSRALAQELKRRLDVLAEETGP